ncbi:hypothetical protein SPRG_16580 [Saprolegnia parasitica CBS 223.65]|uniref:RING-type domain-containing protein n=1 Tax=Saprolegnia parasitica (strain CBS 223.65) TaxID=695850 RepID=A0A067BUU6_SAPPC|nr:hypothetical protein SPRG_16580 [Saprolegnia parasitica CBS 223.65]KDO18056.1 hypothetical protein SPRG_16580 [Saprolegnia parasitica CBS 223.65]|eukprot:XP_012211236.1 hypothetical protein SPRG_16580 [Saprolegnia parasitica CBS 223.65]
MADALPPPTDLQLAPWASLWPISTSRVPVLVSIGRACSMGYYVHTIKSQLDKEKRQVLAYILRLPFPKKHFDAEKPSVIAERMQNLGGLVSHVWSLYAAAWLHALQYPDEPPVVPAGVLARLFIFLCIPQEALNVTVTTTMLATMDDACPICLECFAPPTEIVLELACGHGFHVPCLRDWLVITPRCPTCRGAPGSTVLHVPS